MVENIADAEWTRKDIPPSLTHHVLMGNGAQYSLQSHILGIHTSHMKRSTVRIREIGEGVNLHSNLVGATTLANQGSLISNQGSGIIRDQNTNLVEVSSHQAETLRIEGREAQGSKLKKGLDLYE